MQSLQTNKITISYKPLPHQKRFHTSKAKFRAIIGGIGSGKTLAGIHESIRRALKHPGSVGMIVAPTYPMLRDTVLRTFFEEIGGEESPLISQYRVQDKEVHLVNGSIILFRSADKPKRLRGPNIDWFYIDEAAMTSRRTWDILIGRIRRGVVDKGWIATTPKGFDWVYEVFEKDPGESTEYFHAQSSDNKHLPSDYLRSLKERYSGTFYEQEVQGLFRAFEGIVYKDFNPKLHVKPRDWFKPVEEYKEVVVGVDWGYTNPTTFLIIGVTGDQDYHVLEEFYETRLQIGQITQKAKGYQERYQPTFWYCDPSEPSFIDEFNQSGIPAEEGINEITPGINKVASFMQPKQGPGTPPRLFISESCENLINELQKYRFPEAREGRPNKDKPLKVDDHLCDGLRYALHTYSEIHSFSPTFGKVGAV